MGLFGLCYMCAGRWHLFSVVAHIPLLPFIACCVLVSSRAQLGSGSGSGPWAPLLPCIFIVLEQCFPFGCATDFDLPSHLHTPGPGCQCGSATSSTISIVVLFMLVKGILKFVGIVLDSNPH